MLDENTVDWIGEELIDALYERLDVINSQLADGNKIRFKDGGGYTVVGFCPFDPQLPLDRIEIYFEIEEEE